jgi:tetratricopeptide (TPR) repeat protein
MKTFILLTGAVLFTSFFSLAQDYKRYDDGLEQLRNENYAAAADIFSSILNDPSHNKRFDEDLYFYRGQAYFHLDKPQSAITDLDASLKLDHFNKGVIYWYKARCADRLGRTAEATALYEQALTSAANNKKVSARILADRATFFARQGNSAAAQEDLTLARSLDPSTPQPTNTPVRNAEPNSGNAESGNKKLIVQNNQSAGKGNASKQVNNEVPPQPKATAAEPPQTTSSLKMVSTLADLYKDEKRFALVIGNSNYTKEIGTLKNPVNDATDIAAELRKSNFDVQLLTNATYIQIREAMRKFQEKLSSGPRDQTVGLFYYAGHGVQYQDENYLVPIDANVKYEDDIVRMCFPVQRMVLNNMENTNSRMNIIILDACRNNPFPVTTRSLSQGLGEMKRARGSFIAYATAPGAVASDGNGRNGLYTQELLKALRTPGLTIEQVFKEVRMNVLRLSGDKQFTWDSSNIIGEFYFRF